MKPLGQTGDISDGHAAQSGPEDGQQLEPITALVGTLISDQQGSGESSSVSARGWSTAGANHSSGGHVDK